MSVQKPVRCVCGCFDRSHVGLVGSCRLCGVDVCDEYCKPKKWKVNKNLSAWELQSNKYYVVKKKVYYENVGRDNKNVTK